MREPEADENGRIRGNDPEFRKRLERGLRPLTPEQKKLGEFYQRMRKLAQHLNAQTKSHVEQEAEKESHSSNPHIRARGILGKRFMSGDLHR